jgi:ligand-binding sensor domain-containing protein/serine phosphatase RsbU (regulator of sigma subunit)
MLLRRKLILIFLVLFGPFLVQGQVTNFKIYNEDNGLAQGYVYHISQDKRGYLVVSTGDGLSIFGGTVFKSFKTADGLAENFITTHFVDSKNNIWVGHYQEGISFFNRKTNRLQRINAPDLKNIRINAFTEDKQGNIFAATSGKGLVRIAADLSIHPVEGLGLETITDICFDKWGNLITGHEEGLTVFRLNKSFRLAEAPVEIAGLKGFKTAALIQNADSSLVWAAMNDKGIAAIQNDKGTYFLNRMIAPELHLHEFNFRSLSFDANGALWISTFGEGLRKLSFTSKGALIQPVPEISTKNGLTSNYIQSIFTDSEGNLWIGTYGNGLMEMSDNKFLFFPSEGKDEEKSVNCVLTLNDGRVLMGTDAGIKVLNPYLAGGTSPRFIPRLQAKITSLYADKHGLLWIGTAAKGLFSYDEKKAVLTDISSKYGLHNQHINSINGNDNTILAGTTDGLYVLSIIDARSSLLLQTQDGLLHNNIYQVCMARDGRIWMAAHGAPPFSYYEGKITAYKNLEELKSFNINSVHEDKTGIIWLATEGDGVFSYDGTRFKNYKVSEGLASNYCYSIACDKNNTVWIGHKSGISEKQFWAANFTNYGKKDGVLAPELNLNASASDNRGNVWFGTGTGLLEYSRENDRPNTQPPFTQILGITINNKYCVLPPDTILPAGNYALKFDYLGVSQTHPENIRYRYMLEGFETEWNNVNAQNRTAVYPKLGDGEYTFKLQACNNEGIWNARPVVFNFKIRKYFWKTAWFFLLASAMLFALLLLLIQWRTRNLQRQSAHLERLVSKKTEQLKKEKERVEKINHIIEAQNTDITDSINYAKRIQEAMLPSRKEIHDNLNCFVFYKPRDIVSGDFYWYSELSGARIVAAVDCTGHGVPGAFMSLIGSTLLKNIITESGQGSPAGILEMLNKKIIESLHQINSNFTSNDGMEIVLCNIQPDGRKVVFAGANRPLYLVRKGELREYGGSSFPIGGLAEAYTATYTAHSIDTEPGDMLYLTTDGFADQFGGGKNRKFSSKRMKELFSRIASLPVESQEEAISVEFENWKGEGMQIDDILVMGIQL